MRAKIYKDKIDEMIISYEQGYITKKCLDEFIIKMTGVIEYLEMEKSLGLITFPEVEILDTLTKKMAQLKALN